MASIQDYNIDWKRQRIYIPVTAFTGLTFGVRLSLGAGGDAVTENGTELRTANAATRVLRDATTGTAQNIMRFGARDTTNAPANVPGSYLVELNSLGTYGLMVLTAGDGLRHFWMAPYNIDPTRPVGLRAVWTDGAGAVGVRSVTWRVRYSALALGAALITPATALDTVIAAAVPTTTAFALRQTARGLINGTQTTPAPAVTAYGFNLRVDASALAGWAGAGSNDNPFLLGLEIDYMPSMTLGGRRNNRDKNVTTDPLGVSEA